MRDRISSKLGIDEGRSDRGSVDRRSGPGSRSAGTDRIAVGQRFASRGDRSSVRCADHGGGSRREIAAHDGGGREPLARQGSDRTRARAGSLVRRRSGLGSRRNQDRGAGPGIGAHGANAARPRRRPRPRASSRRNIRMSRMPRRWTSIPPRSCAASTATASTWIWIGSRARSAAAIPSSSRARRRRCSRPRCSRPASATAASIWTWARR